MKRVQAYHYAGSLDKVPSDITIQSRRFGGDNVVSVYSYPVNTAFIECEDNQEFRYNDLPDNFKRFVGNRTDFYEFFRQFGEIDVFRVIPSSGHVYDAVERGDLDQVIRSRTKPVDEAVFHVHDAKVRFDSDPTFECSSTDVLDEVMECFAEIVGYS